MALVALASNRSPGLTTATLALAMAWPVPRRAVVAELDPSGGTIAARQLVSHDPGLLALAADGTHGVSGPLVLDHLQQLPSGLGALLAPPGPDRACAGLTTVLAAGFTSVAGALPGLDVLADCGRVDTRSPSLAVLRDADLCVFVARPTTQDIIGLEHRLQTLAPAAARSGLVVIGQRPYAPEDAARITGLRLLGTLADDERTATRVADGTGGLGRSNLGRSAAVVADMLVRDLPDPPPAPGVPDVRAEWSQADRSRVAPSAVPPTPVRPR